MAAGMRPAAPRLHDAERFFRLSAELAEAEDWNDVGRRQRLEDELETLRAELGRAVGLGGRARRWALICAPVCAPGRIASISRRPRSCSVVDPEPERQPTREVELLFFLARMVARALNVAEVTLQLGTAVERRAAADVERLVDHLQD